MTFDLSADLGEVCTELKNSWIQRKKINLTEKYEILRASLWTFSLRQKNICKNNLIDHSSVGFGVVGTFTQKTHQTSQFAWSIKTYACMIIFIIQNFNNLILELNVKFLLQTRFKLKKYFPTICWIVQMLLRYYNASGSRILDHMQKRNHSELTRISHKFFYS